MTTYDPDRRVRAARTRAACEWLASNYALVVKCNRGEPCVVMHLRNAIEVARVAEGKAAEPVLVPLREQGRIVVERAPARISAMPDRW
jgi:hypothetical protein